MLKAFRHINKFSSTGRSDLNESGTRLRGQNDLNLFKRHAMKETISQLEKIIVDYGAMMKDVSEERFSMKPDPKKWSKTEILGHTIDSAQNNIRRFIVAQYENVPMITYDQDQWVSISNYKTQSSRDLINLWILLNRHICHILENTSPKAAARTCESDHGEVRTIEFLAANYVKHLLHHLHQILELEPVEYK